MSRIDKQYRVEQFTNANGKTWTARWLPGTGSGVAAGYIPEANTTGVEFVSESGKLYRGWFGMGEEPTIDDLRRSLATAIAEAENE